LGALFGARAPKSTGLDFVNLHSLQHCRPSAPAALARRGRKPYLRANS
jgi:hypothetical protein